MSFLQHRGQSTVAYVTVEGPLRNEGLHIVFHFHTDAALRFFNFDTKCKSLVVYLVLYGERCTHRIHEQRFHHSLVIGRYLVYVDRILYPSWTSVVLGVLPTNCSFKRVGCVTKRPHKLTIVALKIMVLK